MDLAKAQSLLAEYWKLSQNTEAVPVHLVDESIASAIEAVIQSKTKAVRYALPTQILAKLTDPGIDARAIQRDTENGFDARTFARKVIVPFDRENSNVLGGSGDPYVGNPLRVKTLSAEGLPMKDTKSWNDLLTVLTSVQDRNVEEYAKEVFFLTLVAIRQRLSETSIQYPVPNRISHLACKRLLDRFLVERSGGDRLLAVSSALFTTLGQRFSLFDEVRRNKINASDASTGMVADLECFSREHLVLAVEVKDRKLHLTHIQEKLPRARIQEVTELFFIASTLEDSESTARTELIEREFASGQNIYTLEFDKFLEVVLALLGEAARKDFLVQIGTDLDEYGSALEHRRAFANLLVSI